MRLTGFVECNPRLLPCNPVHGGDELQPVEVVLLRNLETQVTKLLLESSRLASNLLLNLVVGSNAGLGHDKRRPHLELNPDLQLPHDPTHCDVVLGLELSGFLEHGVVW